MTPANRPQTRTLSTGLLSTGLLSTGLLSTGLLVTGLLVTGCSTTQPVKTTKAPAASQPSAAPQTPVPRPPRLDALERREFNRLAAAQALPLFWINDTDANGKIAPDETAVLFLHSQPTPASDWITDGRFTEGFYAAYRRLLAIRDEAAKAGDLSTAEVARRAAVAKELAQGEPTLVLTDLGALKASPEDRAIVKHVLAAARLVERIHAKQRGVFGMAAQVPADHPPSRALFQRNQGPWCVAPKTEVDKACSALATRPARLSGLYPAALQRQPKFCEALARRKDGEKLLHQFHVVRQGKGDTLEAVPYSVAYAEESAQISAELRAAAAAIKSSDEQAFKTYLLAAAQAFTDNNWLPADEAWSKMSVRNSKWYLRIGPDEVYFEPCNRKAGFHVSFARINRDSLAWQAKLEPVKRQMERALARLAGPPYRARKVSFHLPDFIDMIVNAGDARSPLGATIGQSLPNWGPVANEGRGRTVAMTNLYTDDDSKAQLRVQASALLCPAAMKRYTDDTGPQVMSTVLHEAAHNLGPAHEYRVRGKKATQIFGGPMASTLEELKSQTAALFFTDWLVTKKIIDREAAELAHTRDLVWAFGHIARGMYTASGKPKSYSQLAAIQLGFLLDNKAMSWQAGTTAANGSDRGCFALELGGFGKAVKALMRKVARIKARGDRRGADALKKRYVDSEGEQKRLLALIRERWLRHPKASFVYAIRD